MFEFSFIRSWFYDIPKYLREYGFVTSLKFKKKPMLFVSLGNN